MTDLTDAWDEWKKVSKRGERNQRVLDAEAKVHAEQKKINAPPYDFDSRWEKIQKESVPTVSGPPQTTSESKPTETAPQSNFTFEEAKALVGSNDFAILEFCNKLAEARIVCLDTIARQTNSTNKTNNARKGQSINQSLAIFNDYKNDPDKYAKYMKEKDNA